MATKPKAKSEELPFEARCIRCIQDFPAPATTQDALDQASAEFATAKLLSQLADKRYDAAKKTLIGMNDVEVAKLRNEATENLTKATHVVQGEDWQVTFAANRPASKCDVDELRTELVRQGIKVTIIDAAIMRVTKYATPALVITASRTPE